MYDPREDDPIQASPDLLASVAAELGYVDGPDTDLADALPFPCFVYNDDGELCSFDEMSDGSALLLVYRLGQWETDLTFDDLEDAMAHWASPSNPVYTVNGWR